MGTGRLTHWHLDEVLFLGNSERVKLKDQLLALEEVFLLVSNEMVKSIEQWVPSEVVF